MKKSKLIVLSLAPIFSALLAGCGSEESKSRDVYASKEECVQDWNQSDLCEQMDASDDRDYSGGTTRGYFWGPPYYGGSRSVSYRGNTITPTRTSSTLHPFSVTSRSSSASRTSSSSPVNYGGFGGRSSSSSSSS